MQPIAYTDQEENSHALKIDVSNQTSNNILPTVASVFLINNNQKLNNEWKKNTIYNHGPKSDPKHGT